MLYWFPSGRTGLQGEYELAVVGADNRVAFRKVTAYQQGRFVLGNCRGFEPE